MIPQLVTVHLRQRGGRRLRLYVPVLPVAVVLSPLLLLAVVGGLVACRITSVSPTGALRGVGRLLWTLPGTSFEIEQGPTAVLVSIR
jgi:hypothetical protein